MLRHILTSSRYLVLIAVLGSFLASLVVLLYDGITVIGIIVELVTHLSFTTDGAKKLALECIQVIDLFLLGTVLYIIALGLYELFIDIDLPVLPWLVITSLDDLKAKLTGVIIVLLAVTFLANVVNWNGSTNILALGLAVGLVLFALGYILNTGKKNKPSGQQDHPEDE